VLSSGYGIGEVLIFLSPPRIKMVDSISIFSRKDLCYFRINCRTDWAVRYSEELEVGKSCDGIAVRGASRSSADRKTRDMKGKKAVHTAEKLENSISSSFSVDHGPSVNFTAGPRARVFWSSVVPVCLQWHVTNARQRRTIE
jgi:hypothetical protein